MYEWVIQNVRVEINIPTPKLNRILTNKSLELRMVIPRPEVVQPSSIVLPPRVLIRKGAKRTSKTSLPLIVPSFVSLSPGLKDDRVMRQLERKKRQYEGEIGLADGSSRVGRQLQIRRKSYFRPKLTECEHLCVTYRRSSTSQLRHLRLPNTVQQHYANHLQHILSLRSEARTS
jgi:hypothetical protein